MFRHFSILYLKSVYEKHTLVATDRLRCTFVRLPNAINRNGNDRKPVYDPEEGFSEGITAVIINLQLCEMSVIQVPVNELFL